MSTRRVHESPSFTKISTEKELLSIEREIKKLKPPAEVSLEGVSEVADGRIIDWNPARRFFIVKWKHRSEKFSEITDSQTGLRVFFKIKLFTTQVIFKTTTVRRFEDGTFHYRIPTELFKQQRRGALRVPLKPGAVKFKSKEGTFEVLDLSVGGAKLKTPKAGLKVSAFSNCELNLDGYRLRTPEFEAKITYLDPNTFGLRFSGINEEIKIEIKQFLIEALRVHYEDL